MDYPLTNWFDLEQRRVRSLFSGTVSDATHSNSQMHQLRKLHFYCSRWMEMFHTDVLSPWNEHVTCFYSSSDTEACTPTYVHSLFPQTQLHDWITGIEAVNDFASQNTSAQINWFFFSFEGLEPCYLVDQWHVARRQTDLKKNHNYVTKRGNTVCQTKAIFKKYKCIFNKHVYIHGLELNSTTQLKTSIIHHLLCKLSIRNETFIYDKMWWHVDSKIYV